jgi:hypothetical protein
VIFSFSVHLWLSVSVCVCSVSVSLSISLSLSLSLYLSPSVSDLWQSIIWHTLCIYWLSYGLNLDCKEYIPTSWGNKGPDWHNLSLNVQIIAIFCKIWPRMEYTNLWIYLSRTTTLFIKLCIDYLSCRLILIIYYISTCSSVYHKIYLYNCMHFIYFCTTYRFVSCHNYMFVLLNNFL